MVRGGGTPESGDGGARRGGRARAWLIGVATALVLLPATLWLATYFWVNSSPGRALILDWAFSGQKTDAVRVADLRWGPWPDKLEIIRFAVVDADDATLLGADHVTADIDLSALVEGRVALDAVTATTFAVHLGWDADGRFNVARALARDEGGEKPATPPRPRGGRSFEIRGIALRDGVVTLKWPDWGLDFRAVDADGRILLRPGEGPEIDADLVGGHASAVLPGGRPLDYDALEIGRFAYRDDGFSVGRLAMTGAEGARVALEGGAWFGGEPIVEARGDVVMAPAQAAIFTPDQLPGGARLEGLLLNIEGEAIHGSVDAVAAPELTLGPMRATDVALSVTALKYVAGLLRPTGLLRLEAVRADHMAFAGDVEARGVDVGSLVVLSHGKTSLDLSDATFAELSTPAGLVGPTRAQALVNFRLTSGTIDAFVDAGEGSFGASGEIRVNPLTTTVRVTVNVAFAEVAGALATYLIALMEPSVVGELTPPLAGRAIVEGTLGKRRPSDDAPARWMVETELLDARVDGGSSWAFDGADWTRTRAVDAATP